MAGGFEYRFNRVHSATDPLDDCVVFDTLYPGPLGDGVSFALDSDAGIGPPIVRLSSPRYPTAVPGEVTPIVADAVYGQAVLVTMAERPCIELHIVISPRGIHLDPACTVMRVIFVGLIIASAFDRPPNLIEWMQ